MLAQGGTATASGLSIVGEQGPELRYLPRSASVIPLNREVVREAVGGGELPIVVQSILDGKLVGQSVARHVAQRRGESSSPRIRMVPARSVAGNSGTALRFDMGDGPAVLTQGFGGMWETVSARSAWPSPGSSAAIRSARTSRFSSTASGTTGVSSVS